MRAALFETVTPLPDIDNLRPLPPFLRNASGPLVVTFQLNEAGKITKLNAPSLQRSQRPRVLKPPMLNLSHARLRWRTILQ